jgi:hypothetical protein
LKCDTSAGTATAEQLEARGHDNADADNPYIGQVYLGLDVTGRVQNAAQYHVARGFVDDFDAVCAVSQRKTRLGASQHSEPLRASLSERQIM